MSEVSIEDMNGYDVVTYEPQGVCSKLMKIKIKDDVVEDAEITGGCPGNLMGLKILIKGMKVGDIISKLKGIPCGGRGTSCPDQLSKALAGYLSEKQAVKA